ncbi:MAG: electron transport complex subunit RsxC [Ignavibacteriales bacterium]|jgi:electron transport complex protein RnfC|nr:electron transport complex subunit RsxC [Ignavibacteriaceae bacterium]NLH61009.1 electron transport complex subunit RsxC [Ignavibacteriales bacterium]HOJ17044.1 electron transport complex subunit RsxC [Ignavibacteriaceae bacterium]
MSLFSFAKKTFRGGVHPFEHKEMTENLAFEIMPDPPTVIVPLSQHIGKQATPIVKKGSVVSLGSVVAEPQGFVSIPIHSPVSGKVMNIHREPNTSGYPKDAIIIQTDTTIEGSEKFEPLNYETISGEAIRERVRIAGLVGQGGAAFPTFIKLSPPDGKKIDYVILNGCECEPYLTRDYRLMLEKSEDVVVGLNLIMKAVGVENGIIGIEDNKPEAIEKLKGVATRFKNIKVEVLETKYPQGAEKMLIRACVGREVPPGKLPMDAGVIVQNIGTATAIYDAVVKGEPQLYAALTVTGKGINSPKNLMVKVGTPLQEVLDYCGGVKEEAVKVIVGGPMMGIAQFDFSAPVMKATSGIVVLTKEEVNEHPETPCLKCGKCIEACPINLVPTKLSRYSQLERYEDAEDLNITSCMECGTCTFTCPANIPLVQWIRLGKQKVIELQKEKKTA